MRGDSLSVGRVGRDGGVGGNFACSGPPLLVSRAAVRGRHKQSHNDGLLDGGQKGPGSKGHDKSVELGIGQVNASAPRPRHTPRQLNVGQQVDWIG